MKTYSTVYVIVDTTTWDIVSKGKNRRVGWVGEMSAREYAWELNGPDKKRYQVLKVTATGDRTL